MFPCRSLSFVLLAAALLLSGCSVLGQDPISGYLVTNTTVPFTLDLDNTPVTSTKGESAIVRIREPFTNVGVYTELNTTAIGDIARENGLQKVYFADLKTFSIFSIWRTHTLVIYGEK